MFCITYFPLLWSHLWLPHGPIHWSHLSPHLIGFSHNFETLSSLVIEKSTLSGSPPALGGAPSHSSVLLPHRQWNLLMLGCPRNESLGFFSVQLLHSLYSLLWIFTDTFPSYISSSSSSLNFWPIYPIFFSVWPLGVLMSNFIRPQSNPWLQRALLLVLPGLYCLVCTDQKSWCHPSFLSLIWSLPPPKCHINRIVSLLCSNVFPSTQIKIQVFPMASKAV